MRVEDMMPASDAYRTALVTNAIKLEELQNDIDRLATYCYEQIKTAANAGYFYCDIKHPLFANVDVASKICKAFRELGYHTLTWNPIFAYSVTQKYEQCKPNELDLMIRFIWDEEYTVHKK